MPIYVYICAPCEVRKEIIVSSEHMPLPPCPVCGKDMTKDFTAASFTIK